MANAMIADRSPALWRVPGSSASGDHRRQPERRNDNPPPAAQNRLKAIISGRSDEVFELGQTNLRR
jgi:hypothetical protein